MNQRCLPAFFFAVQLIRCFSDFLQSLPALVFCCDGMQRHAAIKGYTGDDQSFWRRNHEKSQNISSGTLFAIDEKQLTEKQLPEINRNIAFENSPFTPKRKIHLNQPWIFRDKLLVSGMVVLMVEYSQQALPLFQSVRIFEKSHIKEKTHVYLVPKLYPWDDCIFAYMQTINISHSCG